MTDRRVRSAQENALAGLALSRNEIVELLEIPLGSGEDKLLRSAAEETAHRLTGEFGYVWSAVGADFAPCPMNCGFCSLGEKWGIANRQRMLSDDEILGEILGFVEAGARFVVLRTTEFYSLEVLSELVGRIRSQITGPYEIVLNVGEFDVVTAERLFDCGVSGIYHACRLREGTDTPFLPDERLETMESVFRSPLKLISLVEPIGPEHTNEEIADNFLEIVRFRAEISGAMARVPVAGTPLGKIPPLNASRLAQIIAVLRLSGGSAVKDICVHPASEEAVRSGANVVVVETGAIPRDSSPAEGGWNGFGVVEAKKLLERAGFVVRNRAR